MENSTILIVYIPFSIATFLLLLFTLKSSEKQPIARIIRFMAIALLGWQLSNIAYYATGSLKWTYFFYDFALPFIALTALSVLIFVAYFYGLNTFFLLL